ncbi:MAG: hypothetical protein COA78_05370 [Blastopirellula sp.]|nr:MAG: hypothetical protein COA78_05370 [Blastopirellula sp.]
MVKHGVIYFFLFLLQCILRGKRIPTIIGGILGGIGGSFLGLALLELRPAGIFFGAILGASIIGGIFPRPVIDSNEDSEDPITETN